MSINETSFFTLTFTRVNPANSSTYSVTEEYVEKNGTFWTVYRRNDGTWDTGMGYSGVTRLQFTDEWQREREVDFKALVKRTEEGIMLDALLARYDTEFAPKLRAAVDGLAEEENIMEALKYIVEYGKGFDTIAALDYSNPKALRKVLIAAYRDGKESARENYPEDYRDSDDKGEFYEMYSSDVADAMAGSL